MGGWRGSGAGGGGMGQPRGREGSNLKKTNTKTKTKTEVWGSQGSRGGVEPASARAVCQTREKFSVAGRSAYNEVAGGLTMVYMDDLKIYIELVCNLLRREIVKGNDIHIDGKPVHGGGLGGKVTQVPKPAMR